jgi:predicted nucleotidyltransferase
MVVILNLNNFLKTNKNARRIFGKKELEIIFKQLEGLLLTQSEKNRLSRDIKPKLEFIREISKFENEFMLKKDQGAKEIIDKAVKVILQDKLNEKIQAIFLFGSRVSGIITPRSDVDICVVFDSIEKEDADRFRIRILGNFSDKADIQVFNALPQKIKRSIAKSHKILYKKENFDNNEFVGFEIARFDAIQKKLIKFQNNPDKIVENILKLDKYISFFKDLNYIMDSNKSIYFSEAEKSKIVILVKRNFDTFKFFNDNIPKEFILSDKTLNMLKNINDKTKNIFKLRNQKK